MENISNLLNLEQDERILEVFQFEKKTIEISKLNPIHKIENLPRSYFEINTKEISFINTHVFTNKRYINIGVNFWQLKASYDVMGNKIKIDNYLLSIQKEHIQSLEFKLEWSHIGIILNGIVDIRCFYYSEYESVRKFIIEQWGFIPSSVEKEEKSYSSRLKIIYCGFNFLELVIIIVLLIGNWLHFFSFISPVFFTIVLIIFSCISILMIIRILTLKKKKFFIYQFWLLLDIWLILQSMSIFFIFLSL